MSAQPASAAKLTRGIATGTVYFNKLETQDVAKAGPGAVAVLCGPIAAWNAAAGAICAVETGAAIAQANRAINRDMCLKLKFSPPTFPYLAAATWPDIYRGDYCN
jgi:hypothetical protein